MRFLLVLLLCLGITACSDDMGPDQHGREVTREALQGRWLIINYWAQWCAPCRREVPELNALAAENPAIAVLGVNYDGLTEDELQREVDAMGIRFTVLQKDPSEHFQFQRPAALPATYLIDPKGEMREQLTGEQNASSLLARLHSLAR